MTHTDGIEQSKGIRESDDGEETIMGKEKKRKNGKRKKKQTDRARRRTERARRFWVARFQFRPQPIKEAATKIPANNQCTVVPSAAIPTTKRMTPPGVRTRKSSSAQCQEWPRK